MYTFTHLKTSDLVLHWLQKPHVKEFWGDAGITPEDLVKFTNNKESVFIHWVASKDGVPFAYISTSDLKDIKPYDQWSNGRTKSFDFLIGEEAYMGKGLAVPTIKAFMSQMKESADTMITDPEARNLRAIHVYEKAGFIQVADFIPHSGLFPEEKHLIMRLSLKDVVNPLQE